MRVAGRVSLAWFLRADVWYFYTLNFSPFYVSRYIRARKRLISAGYDAVPPLGYFIMRPRWCAWSRHYFILPLLSSSPINFARKREFLAATATRAGVASIDMQGALIKYAFADIAFRAQNTVIYLYNLHADILFIYRFCFFLSFVPDITRWWYLRLHNALLVLLVIIKI